ncbi:MAG TPA: hypothetical protein VMX11_06130 [Actinomycetes bacterium]|nr:hypothetical protein [Actinomycetes bacterium]
MVIDIERVDRSAVRRRRAGMVCLGAGLLGAASGVGLALLPSIVDQERFSYPLGTSSFVGVQIWFVVQHLGLIVGLLALAATGASGSGQAARAGQATALAGMGLLTVTELVAVLAAQDSVATPLVVMLGASYGISTVLVGVGLVLVGWAVLRQESWLGWRRLVPLALGCYVFVPMIPALAGPFVVARLAIAGWMVLFALLGWVLVEHPESEGSARG